MGKKRGERRGKEGKDIKRGKLRRKDGNNFGKKLVNKSASNFSYGGKYQ